MYYITDITIFRRFLENEHLLRVIIAKDKNDAYSKVKSYLDEIYISDSISNEGVKYDIEIHDTIGEYTTESLSLDEQAYMSMKLIEKSEYINKLRVSLQELCDSVEDVQCWKDTNVGDRLDKSRDILGIINI